MGELGKIRKQLKDNDHTVREKGLVSLHNLLRREELSEKNQLKVWESAFDCFWLTDKVPVQQAMAYYLAHFILIVPSSSTISFIRAFWQIHCKEWQMLDRHRHDKFYSLFRRVVGYSFKWLANQHWDKEAVTAYTDMLLEGALHPTDQRMPNGVRYHIMEIYHEELNMVIQGKDYVDEPELLFVQEKVEDSDEESDEEEEEKDEQEQDEEQDEASQDEASQNEAEKESVTSQAQDEADVPIEDVMRPLEYLAKSAADKIVRQVAKECLKAAEEERLAKRGLEEDETEEPVKKAKLQSV